MSHAPGSSNPRKSNNNWWSRQDPRYHGYPATNPSRPSHRYLNQVQQPISSGFHHSYPKPHHKPQHGQPQHHQVAAPPQAQRAASSSGAPSNTYPATFPSDKSKNVTCTFCKHKLFVNRELKSAWSPLLLPCGHVTCSNCETANPRRPCTLCPEQPIDGEVRERLPHNLYLVGLVHALSARPVHIEDPDMSFHQATASQTGPNLKRGCCSECGMIPSTKCETCGYLFCKLCNSRIHKGALQDHVRIPLSTNAADLPLSNVCPNHDCEPCSYYCTDCDFEGCSGCMMDYHRSHQTSKQAERNKEYLPEFYAAWEKLQHSKWWTQQTRKKLKDEMACPQLYQQSTKIENEISRHFTYLHGILQNLEQQLRSQLRKQRSDHQKRIDEFTNRLVAQEEKLTSAIRVAADVERNNERLDLKKFTEKLLEFANLPCHLIRKDDDGVDEGIRLEVEGTIVENIKQHLQLHISERSTFEIVSTDYLPEGHELEVPPLPESMSSVLESSVRSYSERDAPSPCFTAPSHSSSNVSLDESQLDESSANDGLKDLVEVTHINDPQDFYVIPLSAHKALREIESEIARIVESEPTPAEELHLNQMYIVQKSDDMKWYRGRLTNVDDKQRCDIFYVDYGWKESRVTTDRMLKFAFSLMSLHNGLAKHCTLRDIAPRDGEWTEEALTRFKEMVAGHTFTMHILVNESPIFTVDLTGKHLNGVSVQKWLLDTKLAKPQTYYKLQRMNPLSARQFYHEKLQIDKFHDAIVVHVESPDCMYINKPQTSEGMEQLHSFYQEYSKYVKSGSPPLKNPEYGTTVALSEASIWHRGTIINVFADEKKVELFLVDTGRTVTVRYSDVSLLPSRFCRYNAQAIRISLADIAPINNDKWSLDAITYLKEQLENQKVAVNPLRLGDKKYEAVVYCQENMINMNANLVGRGYAIDTGISSRNIKSNKNIPAMTKGDRKRIAAYLKGDGASKDTISRKKGDKTVQLVERKKIMEDTDPYKAQVIINKVVSPYDISVSMASNVRAYEKMMRKMQEFYRINQGSLSGELKADHVYCVYSPKDMRFCRAQFLGISEEDPTMARMSLVDLGQVEDIPVNTIQPLEEKFWRVPKYMFKVRLAGIRPCGGSDKWPSTSCRMLNDIIHDTGDIKYFITVVDSQDKDDVIPVSLFIRRNVITGPTEPNRKETISVSQKLKDEGLALPVRGHVEGRELTIELKKKLQLEPTEETVGQEPDCFFAIPTSETPLDSIAEDENENDDDNDNDIDNDNQNEESEGTDTATATLDVSDESCPLPAKRSEWIPAAHLREIDFNANPTYIDDDCSVFFHPDSEEYVRTLNYISETLDKHFTNRSIKSYDHDWEEGDLCIANYHADKKWYRGVVRGFGPNKSLKVEFVDYGNQEYCPIGTVKKRTILQHIPVQATKASLAGLKPEGSRFTTEHLDVIHNVIVGKKLRIKVVSQPPNPWKIAAWLIEGTSLIPVPWFIKNKTQVSCIIDSISVLPGNETFIEESENSFEISKEKTLPFVKPSLILSEEKMPLVEMSMNTNGKKRSTSPSLDSDDTTADADFSLNQTFDQDPSFREDFSETLRNHEDLYANSIVVMNKFGPSKCNGTSTSPSEVSNGKSSPLSTLSGSSLKKALSQVIDSGRSHSKCNGKDDSLDSSLDDSIACREAVLSGHSAYLDIHADEIEIGSVRSEALYNDEKNTLLVSSTPLNISMLDDSDDSIPEFIDLEKYNITWFRYTVGFQHHFTKFSGHLIHTPNEELNKWISASKQDQEEIQRSAFDQPVLTDARAGRCCIAQFQDGLWYRAFVKQVFDDLDSNERIVKVEFLDYGNFEFISDENKIRACKKRWLEPPRMCVVFSLYNVKVVNGHDKQAQALMSELFNHDEVFYAVVKKYEPCLEVDVFTNKQRKKLVYAEVIENGHFQLIG